MIFLCPSTLTENVHKQFECNFVISHSELNWPITFGNAKMTKMQIHWSIIKNLLTWWNFYNCYFECLIMVNVYWKKFLSVSLICVTLNCNCLLFSTDLKSSMIHVECFPFQCIVLCHCQSNQFQHMFEEKEVAPLEDFQGSQSLIYL